MLYTDSPLGMLRIESDGHAITRLSFCGSGKNQQQGSQQHAIEEAAAEQLAHYFSDPFYIFDLAIAPPNETVFRRKVWDVLKTIGAGESLTYQQVAQRIASHPRPVGNACRHNPVPIVVPCHRVVPSSNKPDAIGSYMGQSSGKGQRIKKWLLRHESAGVLR